MTATDVFERRSLWSVEAADAVQWLHGLPEGSVDACVYSPPYEKARLYLENGEDMGIARDTETWVAWMADVFRACLRATKGVVVCVCEGQTKDYRWTAGPALLMADLHRSGVHLRKPPIYRRVGIPGSGGPDWWRNDYEFCIVGTNGGRLPWSDNVATGEPPKYGPGGRMTNRLKNGKRVYERTFNDLGEGGHLKQHYTIPDIANPGNVVSETYTAAQVAGLLQQESDIIDCLVGGGKMGSKASHESEAPFPESLIEPFVRCFSPEGGIVCDPFSGSGTTAKVSLKWGRRFVGCDLRLSQVSLTERRIAEATTLFDTLEAP